MLWLTVLQTVNSLLVRPPAVIRDGFLIRFLIKKRFPLSPPPFFFYFILTIPTKNKAGTQPDKYLLEYQFIRDLLTVISSHKLRTLLISVNCQFQFPDLCSIRSGQTV